MSQTDQDPEELRAELLALSRQVKEHVAWLGRGGVTVALAAVVVTLILVVTLDLDRPTRGLIRVPTTPLTDLRVSMALPPPAVSR